MRLLDLFCGAGGAALGYQMAGFDDITGVDINPQPRYPFKFIQADAMEFDLDGYDLIHASPPCQGYSVTKNIWINNKHLMLIEDIRKRLYNHKYVIENVLGAPLNNPITLCGEMFKLRVIRHRLFETNWYCKQPKHQPHKGTVKKW